MEYAQVFKDSCVKFKWFKNHPCLDFFKLDQEEP